MFLKLCKQEFFWYIWPLVCLDESWCFHKAAVFVNKCAATVPLFACFAYPKSYCSSWDHIIGPPQTLTLAQTLLSFTAAQTLGRCSSGKVSLWTTGDFNPLCSWDNTTSEFIPYHPVLSTGQKKPLNPNLSNFCWPHLPPATQSGGGKPSFVLSKSFVGPCKGRFVCLLLALACLCLLVLHSPGKLGSREPCGKLAALFFLW